MLQVVQDEETQELASVEQHPVEPVPGPSHDGHDIEEEEEEPIGAPSIPSGCLQRLLSHVHDR